MAMLLEIDPIGMVRNRKKSKSNLPLDPYVNDRPYVASSFLSVAIAQTFSSVLRGKCKERSELEKLALPLTIRITLLSCRGLKISLSLGDSSSTPKPNNFPFRC